MSASPPSAKRDLARDIVCRLRAAGFDAYWVGGCVRDFLLGREPQDYDIATGARPEQVRVIFSRTVPVGRKFGVVVVVEDGMQFEVATFRAEAEYHDGRRPARVSFSDAKADALRRDFTINGLYYDPVREQLHDWVGGQSDLQAGVVRTIGAPLERFAEDHLRLLRAVRFATELRFQIDPGTMAAVQALAPKIRVISAERIRDELLRLFRPPEAARGLDLLRQSGLLAEVLPEVERFAECEQSPPYHPEGTVYAHVRLMLELMPTESDSLLPWVVLLHDAGKPATATRDSATGEVHFYGHEKVSEAIARGLLERLRFPRKQIEQAAHVVRQHMQFKDVMRMRKSTLRRLLMRPTFPLELELHRLDCLASHGSLDHYEFLVAQAAQLAEQPGVRPPLVTGRDLLGMGMQRGPALGALLAEIREKQLSDELKTPDEARQWARQRIGEMPPDTPAVPGGLE